MDGRQRRSVPQPELTGHCKLHCLSCVIAAMAVEVHPAACCEIAKVARQGPALSGVSFPAGSGLTRNQMA